MLISEDHILKKFRLIVQSFLAVIFGEHCLIIAALEMQKYLTAYSWHVDLRTAILRGHYLIIQQ